VFLRLLLDHRMFVGSMVCRPSNFVLGISTCFSIVIWIGLRWQKASSHFPVVDIIAFQVVRMWTVPWIAVLWWSCLVGEAVLRWAEWAMRGGSRGYAFCGDQMAKRKVRGKSILHAQNYSHKYTNRQLREVISWWEQHLERKWYHGRLNDHLDCKR